MLFFISFYLLIGLLIVTISFLLFRVSFLLPQVGLEKKCVWLVTVQEAT